jgi:hypothetical protein
VKYRCVLDLRYVNSITLPVIHPMTDLDKALLTCRGKKYFFAFDMLKGFWQCAVGESSQEYFSFATEDNVYSYTRLPQGHIDSAVWFNSQLSMVFRDLIDEGKIIIYIDDVLGCASTFEEYLELLETVINRCDKYGLKINANKCTLGNGSIHFCGRDIDGDGWRFNPRTATAAEVMPAPVTAGELNNFLCIANWMRSSMVDFNKVTAPLHELIEKIKKDSGGGSRKKQSFEHKKLSDYGWNSEYEAVFMVARDLFASRIKVAHWDPKATNCVFTDASGSHWGAIYTQVLSWDDSKEVHEQDHVPIAVASGTFKGSQLNWSTIEREAFPIVKCLTLWEHFLQSGSGVSVYTDHKNIADMFQPERIVPSLGKSQIEKIYRWLYVLSFFKVNQIKYIKGEYNIIADMLSRWGNPEFKRDSSSKKSVYNVRKISVPRNFSQFAPNFKLPSKEIILDAQKDRDKWTQEDIDYFNTATANDTLVLKEDGGYYVDSSLWVPNVDNLRLRCAIVGHTSSGGHRSCNVMVKLLKGHVYWKGMGKFIRDFCNDCLNCIKSKKGYTVPRPWGVRDFPKDRNEVISLDYMYVQSVKEGCYHSFKYVLVIKCEYSGFCEILPCEAADHEFAVHALSSWCARYGVPKVVRSDGGSHFINKVISELSDRMGIRWEVTAAYCSFSNGSVERVNREILKLLLLGLKEAKLSSEYWPQLIPSIMSIINSSGTDRLGGECARKVFLGLDGTDPLSVLYDIEVGLVDIPLSGDKIKDLSQKLVDGFVSNRESVLRYYNKARDRRNELFYNHYLTGKRRKKYEDNVERRED